MDKIEYRVRPVTRYIVTRFEAKGGGASNAVSVAGEYDNADMAYEVGYALCKAEHDRLGYSPGDERIIYPQRHAAGARMITSQTRPSMRTESVNLFMGHWTACSQSVLL